MNHLFILTMKNIIFTIFLIYCCPIINAQDYKIVWQQCIGDEKSVYYYSVTHIPDGYFLTLGINSGEGVTNYHGSADIWVIRTDLQHNIIWERCYGGSDTDNPRKIVPITDTTFYVFGSTWSVDGDVHSGTYGFNDVWVIKINGQGDILWEQTYGSPYYEEPNDLVVTPDGGFVFTNRVGSDGGDISQYFGQYDVWMCKCDAEGNIEWEKTLGNEGLDNGVSLIINQNGNIVMIGAVQWPGGMVTCNPQGEIGNVWLVELDMQGNIVWQECYGGSYYEGGMKILEVNNEYIFAAFALSNDGDVSGHHGPSGPGGTVDIWIVKIDPQGEIIWQKCLGGTGHEVPYAIFNSSNGDILVFSHTTSNDGDVSGNNSNPGNFDVWIAKLDSNGLLLRQQCFGSRGDEYVNNHSVSKINDYRYILASEAKSSSGDVICNLIPLDTDSWFFEIKDCDFYAPAIPALPEGPVEVCTVTTIQSTYNTQPAANSHGYVWDITPVTAGILDQDSTMATVIWDTSFKGTAGLKVFNFNDCGSSSWSETLDINVETCIGINEMEETFAIVYPNPTHDYVVFELKKPLPSGKIFISDLTGRRVAIIPITGEKLVWDTRGLQAGVYLYTLNCTKYLRSGKLILSNH